MSISGNLIGSYSPLGNTFVLVDENGNEITGVCVDNPVVFTAGDNDVREGMVYASDGGVSTGTKKIPSYHTTEGYRIVTKGSQLWIPHEHYDYEKLQAVICAYNTSPANSVAAKKVAILNNVYDVDSTSVLSSITKDDTNARIDFGLTNDTDGMYVIRYFMYKEIY